MTSARPRPLRLLVSASAAAVVTVGVVGVAVASGGRPEARVEAAPKPAAKPMKAEIDPAGSPYLAARVSSFSRSAKRVTLQEKPEVKDRLFLTAPLNLWPQPKERGRPLDVLAEGGKVGVTGPVRNGFAQILIGGQVRWVNKTYLSETKPVPPKPKPAPKAAPTASAAPSTPSAAPAGVTTAPCPDGSGTESGLTSSAVRLYRSVCNAFPALTTYGGYDGHGEHSSGKAIDFMVSDPRLGQAVADWARAHAGELDLYDVIWAQHIWTPQRASEGWRSMPDRGSATANHYDHVHISVN